MLILLDAILFDDINDDNDDGDDDGYNSGELFCGMIDPPSYFHLVPLPKVLITANYQHTASRS